LKEGVEVLARGPIHEAFAAPSQARPLPSHVVPKKPPDPIEELPPDEKPAGDHVIWIPGYWAWDDEAKNFLWVSGFWRVPPPGRQWVPGNWQPIEDGWQWTSGFWANADQQEVTYLPAPPPSIDQGASTPAPDDNSTYVPGCWMYRETRYLWRPGFWLGYQPDWVWAPAQYVWTPGGYVFVDGFWDRPFERRGLLFAPILVAPALLGTPWTYVPQYVVQSDFLMGALFVRASYCHYYFGDYFDAGYGRSGFVPWFDYRIGKGSYDPNFAYTGTATAILAGSATCAATTRAEPAVRLPGRRAPSSSRTRRSTTSRRTRPRTSTSIKTLTSLISRMSAPSSR